jgi:16S rRNA G527 N7-methylase RsmG
MWKQNAQDYPNIFDKSIQKDMKIIIDFLEKDIDLKNKTVLDIGCGNGNFSLLIANKVKNIVAIDSSQSMLDELNKIAKELNITNISTVNSSWDTFNSSSKFDLVVALFTPAIKNDESFEKIMLKTNTGILYGRFSKNDIDICEKIKKEYNTQIKYNKFSLPYKHHSYLSFPTSTI